MSVIGNSLHSGDHAHAISCNDCNIANDEAKARRYSAGVGYFLIGLPR